MNSYDALGLLKLPKMPAWVKKFNKAKACLDAYEKWLDLDAKAALAVKSAYDAEWALQACKNAAIIDPGFKGTCKADAEKTVCEQEKQFYDMAENYSKHVANQLLMQYWEVAKACFPKPKLPKLF